MVDVGLVAIGGVAGAAVIAYGYAKLTGNDATASADLDGDGDDESYTFEGAEDAPFEGVGGDVEVGAEQVEEGIELAVDALEDVDGIGPTRADTLRGDGFETPEDLYYASDAALKDVKGFGDRAVEYIREDIGGIDYSDEDE
jgi:predicted flap endonuclease-1-like 5' DNA nuclease